MTLLFLTLLCGRCLQAALRGTQQMGVPLHVSTAIASKKPLYVVNLLVSGQYVNAIVDTGSTGLIVADKNAMRKSQSCTSSRKQCQYQSQWNILFLACYGDESGFLIQKSNEEIQFGNLPKKQVIIGRAKGVFDPDGAMLTKDDQVFVSVLGLAGHGGHDFSFSQSDALTDFLKGNSLQPVWSLRSVTATGEGRMYMGNIAKKEGQHYTGLNQYHGKYLVVVKGVVVSGTGRRSKHSKQSFAATEFILDTGECFIVLGMVPCCPTRTHARTHTCTHTCKRAYLCSACSPSF